MQTLPPDPDSRKNKSDRELLFNALGDANAHDNPVAFLDNFLTTTANEVCALAHSLRGSEPDTEATAIALLALHSRMQAALSVADKLKIGK